MLTFGSPAWLFGLGALLVPIALHLWHRRGGRPVRIGSIRLLVGAPPATRASWRLQDPWLLLLRCTMLAALIGALARPSWTPRQAPRASLLALVSPDVACAADLVDSLRAAGRTTATLRGPDYWTALQDADRTAPRGTRLVVFAPALLRHFSGARPALRAVVEWHVRPATAGRSPSSGGPERSPPPVARIVTIYADAGREDDARYVAAAVRAAALATGTPAVLARRSTGDATVLTGTDWIMWLSSRPVPDGVREAVRRGATLLQDDATAERRDSTRIVLAGTAGAPLLYRRGETADAATPLWRTGDGWPLLTAAREGRGLRLHFHSRFHPAWSDLVLRPEFPVAFATLWNAPLEAAPAAADDERPVALSQLLPALLPPTARPAPEQDETGRSLFVPLWLLAVALFGVERWMARPR